jgi:SAM-dependent methyltransferase
MLENCHPALPCKNFPDSIRIHRSLGNAAYLPFPDNYFDAALSFGGIGVFADKERAINEMCRVVKPGGRVVFGDEGIAPWLRHSRYGKILMDNNHFYADEVPLNLLPVEARDVTVRWVMGGGFYLVDLTVGEGEPHADFDYQIPGVRGGTLNTRYYGKLEGVTPETKKLVQKARDKSGKSMHQWLDEMLRQAAEKEITE